MKLKIIKIQKKGLDFNEEGICYACLYHETKRKKSIGLREKKNY